MARAPVTPAGAVEAAPGVAARLAVPAPPLDAFVACFWAYEGAAPAHARERILPTGTMELVINLRGESLRIHDPRGLAPARHVRGGLVAGVQSSFGVIDTADQASVIGVHFKPGGAFPFLGQPAGDFHDAHVALDAVWGAGAERLRARLVGADTTAARFRILEAFLLARAARSPARHPAIARGLRALCAPGPPRPIAAVVGELDLGARRFTRRFTEEVGVSPKLFCRIRRFQRALRLIEEAPRPAWAAIAAACGYCDQAHLIRDFRAFSGLSPTAYLLQRGPHFNHVPLLA